MRRVLTLLCGVTLLGAAACGVPGGVEVSGHASQVSPPPTTSPTPSGTPTSADAVAVLRADPQLDPRIKSALVPCAGGAYPIDDRYVDLTGDGVAELVVTVYPCVDEPRGTSVPQSGAQADGAGYAAFVYDLATRPPTRLLAVEDTSLELIPSKKGDHELVLIRDRWAPRDDPCCPTDQSVVLYQWDGTKFIEVK